MSCSREDQPINKRVAVRRISSTQQCTEDNNNAANSMLARPQLQTAGASEVNLGSYLSFGDDSGMMGVRFSTLCMLASLVLSCRSLSSE